MRLAPRSSSPSLLQCGSVLVALLSIGLLAAGCAGEAVSEGQSRSRETGGGPLATIGGVEITEADIEESIGDELAQAENAYLSQRYGLIDSALDNLIRERVLEREAAEQGITSEELVEQELSSIEPPSDDDVERWYAGNRERLEGRSIDELRPQVRAYLFQTAQQEMVTALATRLTEKFGATKLLEPFRVEVATEGSPSIGPADAKVTVVEFSDFECPFCRRFMPTLERLKTDYADSVRVVFRQFPLDNIHASARGAAEASLCAHDQGKFWELHDAMFTEQDRLAPADLRGQAEELGLDLVAYDACMESGRHKEAVQSDLTAGLRLGVNGTPALFVNGRPVPGGAIPFEDLAVVIEDEFQRIGSR